MALVVDEYGGVVDRASSACLEPYGWRRWVLIGFALSVIATVGGVVVVGIVLVKLPPGYFGDSAVHQPLPNIHPLVRWTAVFLKNLLGATLVDRIMAVPGMPGPGIMTIVIGVMLLDFAEKRRGQDGQSVACRSCGRQTVCAGSTGSRRS